MKTFRLCWLTLVFIGVVETFSATIPAFLPIGERFPPPGRVEILAGIVGRDLGSTNVVYSSDKGPLEIVARTVLMDLLTTLPAPRATDRLYEAYINIDVGLPTDLEEWPVGLLPYYGVASTQSSARYTSGKWVLDDPSLIFTGWAWFPIGVPGLKQVEEIIRGPGRGITITTTENGAPDDCSLARGGGNWMGPNVLWLGVGSVLPELTTYREGTITLYIGDDGEWGRYDIPTGNLIARSDPPRQPVPISIVPIPYQKSGYALQGTPEPGPRVKLLVTALQGSVTTVEFSTDLMSWKQLITVTSQDGKPVEVMDTSTEKARFYRAWVPKTQ